MRNMRLNRYNDEDNYMIRCKGLKLKIKIKYIIYLLLFGFIL